ncbi:hypothetical protein [Corallococcus sp. 4LFB]|uniref:hypothetical protein n=1 Tax=Corallococcus sp. 4LFB TaxID=3383249 RepID=UPI0039760500
MVTLALAGSVTACDFEQPNPGCIVQDASFALWWAKYDPVTPPTDAQGNACSESLGYGDQLGVWKFADPVSNTAKLVVRPLNIAGLGAADANNTFDSLQVTGDLSTTTDAEDFCTASNFNSANVNPVVEGETSAVSYTLNNVRVYSSPSSPGTQLTGEVTYSVNGCTSTYVVRAVWPETPCDPTVDQNDPDLGVANCGAGSGINPDFATQCEEVTDPDDLYGYFGDPEDPSYREGRCVPSKAIPSFK